MNGKVLKNTIIIFGAIYIAILLLAAILCFAMGSTMIKIDPNDHEMQAETVTGAVFEAFGVGLSAGIVIILGVLLFFVGAIFLLILILFIVAYIRDVKEKKTKGYCIFLSIVSALTIAIVAVFAALEKEAGFVILAVPALPMLIYAVLSIVASKQRNTLLKKQQDEAVTDEIPIE